MDGNNMPDKVIISSAIAKMCAAFCFVNGVMASLISRSIIHRSKGRMEISKFDFTLFLHSIGTKF